MDKENIDRTLSEDTVEDDYPESLKRFEENYLKAHPNEKTVGHNIYHLVSEDRDGNITSEGFGLNVLTDRGFSNMYTRGNSDESLNTRMYLGDGEFETIDPSSSAMVHAISTTSASVSGTNYDPGHQYTRYVPEMQANKVQWKLCVGSFDYTIWSEDKTVTEIGLVSYPDRDSGTGVLKYHAAIYDADGHKSSFVKRVNEKLTITVYGRTYIPIVKIVNESWDRGVPCAIRSNALCKNDYYDYWYDVVVWYHPYDYNMGNYNAYYASFSLLNYNSGSITDHIFSSNKSTSINILLDGRYHFLSDIFASTRWDYANYAQYDTYFIFASKIKSPDPIPFRLEFFEAVNYYSLSLYHTYGHRCRDGNQDNYGQLPMSDIHISSLRMYNGQTDEWDIDVPYTEPDPYIDSGYWHLRYSVREHNWISFQNKYAWYTVFINEAPQYPIKQILYCGKTMYVTDEYWDSSTWQVVPDTSNIPRELGAKRYFIMFDEAFENATGSYDPDYQAYIEPYGFYNRTRRLVRHDYDDKFPKLNLNNGYGEDSVNFGFRNVSYRYTESVYNSEGVGKMIENEEYGYIAQDGFIVFTDTENPNPERKYYSTPTKTANFPAIPYIHNIGGVDLPADMTNVTGTGYDGSYPGMIWNTTRGSHIACCGQNSDRKGIRVYTITDDPTVPPSYQNFLFDQTFSATPGQSHSDNGYLVFSWLSGANNQNCVYVLAYDVEDVEPYMYKAEGYKNAFALDLTDLFVAVDSSVTDHLHMVIYNMATREVQDEFDIPEGYTFAGIAGWNNTVYVRVQQGGAYSTYVYRIQNRTLELTPLNISMMTWDTSSWYSHIQRAARANGNIESCMVLLASDRDVDNQYHMLFKESDPTNPIRLIRQQIRETSSYIRWQKAQLRYTNDGKQLLLTYSTRRNISIDISWALKHGTINTHRCWGNLYYESNDWMGVVYHKGYIYGARLGRQEYKSGGWINGYPYTSTNSKVWRWPYQLWMDMCIEGTTLTANSLMNPVRVQGKVLTMNYQATNRGVDTPEPYVPPEP